MDLNARKTMLIMRRRALLADLASIGKALRPAGLQDAKAAQERVFHALGRVQQIEVERIEAALRRMESGQYGVCTGCGTSILPARLELLPDTPVCEDCNRAA
ncbi:MULTISPECIES: TraR/DksA family transcriptional regulator [Paracoccus]|uniref:TraR/DksA family transcriptional regulator n=1 Tax=Paracoccus versutus TaxID=34007 RepID=A0A3D9XN32_PARVE|nr:MULTISPECIES: TraR/DksA C4-type zinc finger protein [Paracoccus]REF71814.1 TraR/DksA family transcriptional regulator [Paracoccus versutus]WGR56182.1 TraR/DksA family transcriptional regulator [Paracoccus versutus]